MRTTRFLSLSVLVLALPFTASAAVFQWNIIIPTTTLAQPFFGQPCDRCLQDTAFTAENPYTTYMSASKQTHTVRAAAAGSVTEISSSVDGNSGTIVVKSIDGYTIAYSFTGNPVVTMGQRIRKGALLGTLASLDEALTVSVDHKGTAVDLEKIRQW